MGSVGLLYVGAVLFINGLNLLGKIPGKSAAVMNFMVGGMQVVFPTIMLAQADGDPAVILGASGLYLFGFTYLYVGFNSVFDLPGEGLGWFAIFVAGLAVAFGILQFTQLNDPLFGVIWFLWALLWTLTFLIQALGKESLKAFTGWITVFLAHMTGTIPAFLLLSGNYTTGPREAAFLAVAGVLAVAAAYAITRNKPSAASNGAAPAGTVAPNVTGTPVSHEGDMPHLGGAPDSLDASTPPLTALTVELSLPDSTVRSTHEPELPRVEAP
ncbi:MAG: AmiS/UreI family transporter, partial [Micrococcaceae bacterium]|nr:AmiS/UreI family transporter [Micrococcaceae bacterium]